MTTLNVPPLNIPPNTTISLYGNMDVDPLMDLDFSVVAGQVLVRVGDSNIPKGYRIYNKGSSFNNLLSSGEDIYLHSTNGATITASETATASVSTYPFYQAYYDAIDSSQVGVVIPLMVILKSGVSQLVNITIGDGNLFNLEDHIPDARNTVNYFYLSKTNAYKVSLRDIKTEPNEGSYLFSYMQSFTGSFEVKTTYMTKMNYMFNDSAFNSDLISEWDTSNITDMSFMFYDAHFNQSIDKWDVSKVTTMRSMFYNSDFNQPLNSWVTSSLENMESIFHRTDFNHPIDNWDVSKVTTFKYAFYISMFNQDLRKWENALSPNQYYMFQSSPMENINKACWMDNSISQVCNPNDIVFYQAYYDAVNSTDNGTVINLTVYFLAGGSQVIQITLGNNIVFNLEDYIPNAKTTVDYIRITDVLSAKKVKLRNVYTQPNSGKYLFSGIGGFTGAFYVDLTKATSCESMFRDSAFNQSINDWDVSSIDNMAHMFRGSNFNQSLDKWNVSKVTTMVHMFRETPFNQNINNWVTDSLIFMAAMFYKSQFNQPLNNWNVSSVKSMNSVFYETPFNQALSAWNTSSATNMSTMFYGTPFNRDIAGWNVSNVVNMELMFFNAPFNQPVGNWNTAKVTVMTSMFRNSQFNQDLRAWSNASNPNQSNMFTNSSMIDYNKACWMDGSIPGTCSPP